MNRVPNRFPTLDVPYRLAIIGEAPGEIEEIKREPFVGPTGRLLQAVLHQHHIAFSGCFVGNVAQYRPPDNNINLFAWDGPEITEGISYLKQDIERFQPNCCLLLGATALKLAGISSTRDGKSGITAYRGSILRCDSIGSPFFGYKFVPSYHPSAVARSYELLPQLALDTARAHKQSFFPELHRLERELVVDLTAEQMIARLDAIVDGEISVDIEGGVGGDHPIIKCVGIATSPTSAFIVNPLDFSINEQVRIFRALARVLYDEKVAKILQNGLYDNFCLTWGWKMPIRNVRHDTMFSGAEINPELPKSLAFQASIYTEEPYYKHDRKNGDRHSFYQYCCRDAAVTYEIKNVHMRILKGKPLDHYNFHMQLTPAIHYMEQRGMRYDVGLAASRLEEVGYAMREIKARFDSEAGLEINPNTNNGANSLSNILYKKLRFPPQYAKERGRTTSKLTSDVEALLNLARTADRPSIIKGILEWRALESQRRQLNIGADHDGRIRCRYNPVGTETMRFTCSESPTESGANLTTIMKKFRDLYLADEGYEMAQYDLSGADGWTVAAHCNRMGDPTMMDDLRAKIKPAKVIACMHEMGREVGDLSIPDLKAYCDRVDGEGWLYAVCKVVQHGSSYDMAARTMSRNVLLKSYKESGVPLYVEPKICQTLQDHFLLGRYRAICRWQDWVRWELKRLVDNRPNRRLSCASGHVRIFFGRETDPETIRAALSHEPQANTTYATSLALWNLWYDKENNPNGRPIIQPLHQIHDALLVQWPIARRDWAMAKMREYFNNPIRIAEQNILIPFDGGCGPDWKNTKGKV